MFTFCFLVPIYRLVWTVWFKSSAEPWVPTRQNRTDTDQPDRNPGWPQQYSTRHLSRLCLRGPRCRRNATRTASPPRHLGAAGPTHMDRCCVCSSGGEYPRHEPQRRLMTQRQRRGWQTLASHLPEITITSKMLRITSNPARPSPSSHPRFVPRSTRKLDSLSRNRAKLLQDKKPPVGHGTPHHHRPRRRRLCRRNHPKILVSGLAEPQPCIFTSTNTLARQCRLPSPTTCSCLSALYLALDSLQSLPKEVGAALKVARTLDDF